MSEILPLDIKDIEEHVENIKKALDIERNFYQNEIVRLQHENFMLKQEIQQIRDNRRSSQRAKARPIKK
jgi:hypothetical protein